MGLHADVGIKNHLGKPRGFGLLQCVDDAMRAAEKYRVLGERGGLNLLEPLCHLDEISVARRRVLGIAGQRRDCAIPVATYLARAGGVLFGLLVIEKDEVAAHQAAGLPAVLRAGLVIEVSYLLQTAVARGGERRHDQPAAEAGGYLEGWLGK